MGILDLCKSLKQRCVRKLLARYFAVKEKKENRIDFLFSRKRRIQFNSFEF